MFCSLTHSCLKLIHTIQYITNFPTIFKLSTTKSGDFCDWKGRPSFKLAGFVHPSRSMLEKSGKDYPLAQRAHFPLLEESKLEVSEAIGLRLLWGLLSSLTPRPQYNVLLAPNELSLELEQLWLRGISSSAEGIHFSSTVLNIMHRYSNLWEGATCFCWMLFTNQISEALAPWVNKTFLDYARSRTLFR